MPLSLARPLAYSYSCHSLDQWLNQCRCHSLGHWHTHIHVTRLTTGIINAAVTRSATASITVTRSATGIINAAVTRSATAGTIHRVLPFRTMCTAPVLTCRSLGVVCCMQLKASLCIQTHCAASVQLGYAAVCCQHSFEKLDLIRTTCVAKWHAVIGADVYVGVFLWCSRVCVLACLLLVYTHLLAERKRTSCAYFWPSWRWLASIPTSDTMTRK